MYRYFPHFSGFDCVCVCMYIGTVLRTRRPTESKHLTPSICIHLFCDKFSCIHLLYEFVPIYDNSTSVWFFLFQPFDLWFILPFALVIAFSSWLYAQNVNTLSTHKPTNWFQLKRIIPAIPGVIKIMTILYKYNDF